MTEMGNRIRRLEAAMRIGETAAGLLTTIQVRRMAEEYVAGFRDGIDDVDLLADARSIVEAADVPGGEE